MSRSNALTRNRNMNIQSISSFQEYEEALKEARELWESDPDGDRLDFLATMIDEYEEKMYPMDDPSELEILRIEKALKDKTKIF